MKLKIKQTRHRMSFYKSLKNFYVQIIDDEKGTTLCQVNSLKKDNSNTKTVEELAIELSDICKKLKIETVYVARGTFRYLGKIKLFTDVMRKQGLKI